MVHGQYMDNSEQVGKSQTWKHLFYILHCHRLCDHSIQSTDLHLLLPSANDNKGGQGILEESDQKCKMAEYYISIKKKGKICKTEKVLHSIF